MKVKHLFLPLFLLIFSCKPAENVLKTSSSEPLTLAFGSCDNQKLPNTLWDDVDKNKPLVWIWGGDNIYCDTDDMSELQKCYEYKKNQPEYQNFIKNKTIIGTWDDHDYARNDGGEEFEHKKESQQLFLDFFDVPKNSERRKRDGVYDSFIIKNSDGKSVQILVLDTRFFRSKLTPDSSKKKRYLPQETGTMLGETQWNWLQEKLKNSKNDFNIIVSSVQFLSNKHGFEMWGNMPNEVKKLENLIVSSKAKNVIILSGDRHISEFSKKEISNLPYPLIDFTSSGLTHVYEGFKSEENPYRTGFVVNKKNFGILKINLATNKVFFEIRGEENKLLESYAVQY